MRQHVQRREHDDQRRQGQRPRAHHLLAIILCALCSARLLAEPPSRFALRRAAAAGLSVSGTSILLDGQATFLLGVSLFDALGSAPPSDRDLDTLKGWGINTVRVWAHWHEPIYQADGALTAQGRARLHALVERLDARGMVLELVLLRPGQLPNQPYAVFASEAARLRAVREMTTALKDRRRVLFDLYNEHDHGDGPLSHAAARTLRDAVKAIDPARLVTISSTAAHVVTDESRVGDEQAKNLREEAGSDAGSVGVDVVAPHFPRTDDWAAATGPRIKVVREALSRIGRPLPILLSEERRADEHGSPPADAYRRAMFAAHDGGAAGWTFHTEAGFELRSGAFVDSLKPEERKALSGITVRPR